MSAGYPIHGFIDISIEMILGFGIQASGTIRLCLSIIIEQGIVSCSGGLRSHMMRPLSIVVIWVISVHMSSLGLDQALFAPQISTPLQAILIGIGMPAVGMGSSTMSVGGRRGLRAVAVCSGVDIAATAAM